MLLALAVWLLGPQKPERRPEVAIPGVDISLKAGWQLLFHDGCRVAVPLSWRADADGSFAAAADGSAISIREVPIANWSAHKAQMRRAVGAGKVVREDSDRRLWLERASPTAVEHYIDVPVGPAICSGLLEVRRETPLEESTVRTIVESVGPTRPAW